MLGIVKEYYKPQGDKTHSEHHVEVRFLLKIMLHAHILQNLGLRAIKTRIVSEG